MSKAKLNAIATEYMKRHKGKAKKADDEVVPESDMDTAIEAPEAEAAEEQSKADKTEKPRKARRPEKSPFVNKR